MSDLKKVAEQLKDPNSPEASNLKTIFLDISEILIVGSSLIGSIVIKEAVYGLGTVLKMIADHMS